MSAGRSFLATLAALTAPAATATVPLTGGADVLDQFERECDRGTAIWGRSLCGPTILVDPASRAAIASADPGLPGFSRSSGHWTGALPSDASLANSAVVLSGRRFAQILMPLPKDPQEQRILLFHEAFHRIQPELGQSIGEADNSHLDSKDGRILARLEFNALRTALMSADWRPAARDALAYRAARIAKYENSKASEAALLRNEGLAEYTGLRAGTGRLAKRYAAMRLESGGARPSLVRSFGYVAGPAYGILLDRTGQAWRSKALSGTPLPDLLQGAIKGAPPASLSKYGGDAIVAEESARDERIQKRRGDLVARLVEGPAVLFPLEKMAIDFDPNSLFPLGDKGTVYSGKTRIRDGWGTLSISGDVLVSPDWSSARVAGPAAGDGVSLKGPDWEATLASGYGLAGGNGGMRVERTASAGSP